MKSIPKDKLRKIVAAQRVISFQLAPSASTLKLVAATQQTTDLAHDMNRLQDSMRPAFGLINDLRSLTGGVRVAMESGENFRKIQDLMLVTEKQFCLPETNFAMNLIRQFENGALARMIERYELSMPQLQLAMDAMTTSWLDKANERKSVDGFIALQGIGHSLSNMRPFGDRLTDALQVDLGDWSGTFVWPNDIFVDAPARTSFYVSRGNSIRT